MLCLKTTDNNCGKVVSECVSETNGVKPKFTEEHYSDLAFFANAPLEKLLQKNRELLVFPHCLESERADQTHGKIRDSRILEMSGSPKDLGAVEIRTGNLMGFVGKGSVQVEIVSRFASGEKDFFLHYMLSKVFGFNLLQLDFDASVGDVFDVLPWMFPHFLKKALSQGVYKTYRTFERNDANVKGPVNIPRHVCQNIPFCGRIAYRERTRTEDNSLTELVRHTIEFIKTGQFGNTIFSRNKDIRDAVFQITESTPSYNRQERQKVISQNAQPVRHPYFTEWRPLQKLCLAILNFEKIKYHRDQKSVYGILFDGAWLWEEYVYSLIEDAFYHPMNKGGKGAQRLFDGNIGLVYPDFISKNSKARIIADAKYKPMDNVGGRDYLQVLAYMFRFDAKTGYYLYPEVKGADDLKLCMNCGSTYEKNVSSRADISVVKRGLKIPEVTSFPDFVKAIKDSEVEFRKGLIFD